MPSRFRRCFMILFVFVCCGLPVIGQESRDELGAGRGLQVLPRAAGTIFMGTVMSVRRIPATQENELETMQIVFRVDNAIRGAQRGAHLAVREWMGLWPSGERYQVGERVLLFLYPPSRLGLNSPVGGPEGRFAVDDKGRVLVGDGTLHELGVGQQDVFLVL